MSVVNTSKKDIRLVVRERGWGNAHVGNIITLLKNAAFHINQFLSNPFDETINVCPAPIEDNVPRVLDRDSPNDPYIIRLTARDTAWDQYAYQFAHEFCHVLSNYQQLENNWFHEAICELASAFTLRRMGEQWRSNPPFREWLSYADKLIEYSHRQQSRLKGKLPDDISLHSWLLDSEDVLREDEYQRKKNAVVAYQLLPIFEDTPTGWNVVRNFPTSNGYLKDYLNE